MSSSDSLPKKNSDWRLQFGPIAEYLKDSEITEIMINGADKIFIEKNGLIKKTPAKYNSNLDLIKLAHGLAKWNKHTIDPENPVYQTTLPDGSRIHCVLPPVAIDWPTITIRKHSLGAKSHTQLITNGTMDEKIGYFLNCCVAARLNILVCGGTGSGKTTLLNVLSSFIPSYERIITIEDTVELKLKNDNLIRLESKTNRLDSSKDITIGDLVRNALRMRPDRIIVGECRGHEAFDMLTAMNTGHEGSMTTLHANTARDGLRRLETMVLLKQTDVPLKVMRHHISTAVDLIIQINRQADGKRRIVEIMEVGGLESDVILTQDIFGWNQKEGFRSFGLVPRFVEKFYERGINFPKDFFSSKYK